jgi:hypothetical protein
MRVFFGGWDGGALSIPSPHLKFCEANFRKKLHFVKQILEKNCIFEDIFGTAQDFHKSAVKISKKICPPPL